MEIGLGQKYNVVQSAFTVASSGSPVDVLTITSASNVPVVVERVVLTSSANAAAIQTLQVVVRSSAGSGGSSITPSPEPNSAPAASSSAAYNVTTPGTLKRSYDPEIWQQFAPFEFIRRPGGLLIVPGETFVITLPSTSGFTASVHAEIVEVK